ncbi:hypothetical protein AC02_5245 [Escherichia coli 3-020-07_S3_C1]|nr:hypothetical protein AD02_5071 [Escherichia coli 2-460-02_S4_C2]KDY72139.1 hypothetical protein AD32_5242 [Escherichia coli 2-460-02_S4_C3]KDZ33499.1 hypothetical protein AC02_5245 [Escherichia coli 3-020-07_S3_C1]KEJ41689.1 hypothetical protein AC74_5552 [Escherichia coli 2-460-02_S4_C1]KEJ53678.1 hypothetical protein AC30_5741 [Escherichia coli 3-020-07_S3_C2]
MDIHLNPKIGADWQLRWQQKRVVTPGIILPVHCTAVRVKSAILVETVKIDSDAVMH